MGILYNSGGTMRGIFGAGVVTTLQELNAYRYIKELYGSSAGALAGAYLLSRQTRRGSAIYPQNLTKGFITIEGFWGGILDRLVRAALRQDFEGVRDAIDLSVLFDAVRTDKSLDLSALRNSPIPLRVKVLDLTSGTVVYLDPHEDPLALLRASVSMVPYVHEAVEIRGRMYADASIVDPIGFAELRRRHPNEKIVVVFNGDPYFKLASLLKNHIEGFFAHLMFGSPYYKLFADARVRLRRDLDMIARDGNALLIAPPRDCPTLTRTTDREKLLATYEMGLHEGRRAFEFLSS